MNTSYEFKSLDEYATEIFLSSIHNQSLKQPTGTTTDEDIIKMHNRFDIYVKGNYSIFENYYEHLINSYEDIELEVHRTEVLVNCSTGEVMSENFHKIDKSYIEQKKKELSSFKYYRDKVSKSRPRSGIKLSRYKSNHRYTKVFTKARPEFKSHKNKGIFSDIVSDLSPFENIVSSQKNDGSFTPLTTKEIQEKFNISSDDMKQFKAEARSLKVISDVKLQGRALGIRVNPAYAINGQSFSNDVYEAFKDSTEFIENVSKDEENS